MKVKYKEGDIFVIPLSNGKYAICHIFLLQAKNLSKQ
nr:immunity 26/phosphotriesterase HocA family protein [Enterobacter ludwigii]